MNSGSLKKQNSVCLLSLSFISCTSPQILGVFSSLKTSRLLRSLPPSRPSYSSLLPPVDLLPTVPDPSGSDGCIPTPPWDSRGKSPGSLFIPLFPGRQKHPKAERRSWVSAVHSLFIHPSFIYPLIIHPPRPHQSFICLLIHSVCTSRSLWWPQMSVCSCFDLSSSLWQLPHRNLDIPYRVPG